MDSTRGNPKPIGGLYAVETLFTFLAMVAVGLRLWARRLTKRQLAFNDYAAIGALIGNLGFATVAYIGFGAGMGQHMADLADPAHDIVVITKCLLALEALWAIVNVLVKVSILTLYLDLFPGKWFKFACHTTIGVSCCLLIAVMLEVGLLCRPFEYNWNKYIPGTCGETNQAYEAVGIVNLITDLAIVMLPMPVLWGLQIPAVKKIALTFMFGVGALICVISVLRVLSLAIWESADFTYGMRQIAYWSMLEPSLGITNCCLPLMGPIISKATSAKIWSIVSRSKGSSYSGKSYTGIRITGKNNSNRQDDVEAGSFKRLKAPAKDYQMEDMEHGVHEDHTPAALHGSNEFGYVGPESSPRLTKPLPKDPRIAVKHEWQVQHSEN